MKNNRSITGNFCFGVGLGMFLGMSIGMAMLYAVAVLNDWVLGSVFVAIGAATATFACGVAVARLSEKKHDEGKQGGEQGRGGG